ncbi:MAG: hypothetical protein JJU15_06270 [Pararhodobacter sp.]|nr:hypothetical protein [Pararhodobacter sp.]
MPDTGPASATRRFGRFFGRGDRVPGFWRLGQEPAPPPGAFVALVPGAEVPLLSVTLPETLKGTARDSVARRQLQDRLGPDAARMTLRPARLDGNEGWSHLLSAERALVARWRAQVQAARGRCRAILPDYLALPTAPGLWTIRTEATGDAVMVQARLGPGDGFSAEGPLAALLLGQALERARTQSNVPVAVLRLGPPDPALDTAIEGVPVFSDITALPASLSRPRVLAHGEAALDLGTDPLATAEITQQRLVALRWPLALAALGMVAWGLSIEVQTRRDLAYAAALDTATTEAVRRDFLPSGPLLDIPAQITRELERRRTPDGNTSDQPAPLDLLHASSGHIVTSPARLVSLVMQPGSSLTFELEMDDFSTLEALLEDLRASDLPANATRSGTEPDGRVTATLLITMEGGQ